MTNEQMREIALAQSAIDSNCRATDFLAQKNVVVVSAASEQARAYLELPFFCDLTSYGNNIVASVNAGIADTVNEYINRFETCHCFETPNLHILNAALETHGMRVCFMAEYFLPDMHSMQELPVRHGIHIKPLYPTDFASLYLPQWSNALSEKRKHLDVSAMAAYDGNTLVGLAGCSADCKHMRQIGIDVLPEYRQEGLASALVSRLAAAVLADNLVPFYCAAWSNLKSVRTALKSGFRPAWVQLTAKSTEFVSKLNGDRPLRPPV